MPKATKLHPKGKTSTLQKPCNKEKDSTDNADPEESLRQFQLELFWCIQHCERFLSEKKGTEKQMQETWKVLTVLKNNNQPTIRKRQLMRTHFGDYRAKMAAEEKKLAKLASKIKISDTPDKPKATFVRKSAFLTTGDNSFRFNFSLDPQHVPQHEPNCENKCVPDSNAEHLEIVITDKSSDVANTEKSDHVGNTDKTIDVANVDKSNNVANTECSQDKNSKNFKFCFSESQFKFNFNLN